MNELLEHTRRDIHTLPACRKSATKAAIKGARERGAAGAPNADDDEIAKDEPAGKLAPPLDDSSRGENSTRRELAAENVGTILPQAETIKGGSAQQPQLLPAWGLTPELSRPAREAGRSLEATKRVRLE